MSVTPSSLAPLVTRLNNTHAKVKGAPLPIPSSSDLDSLVSSLELIAASLTGANAADLAKLTARLESALTKIGAKIPPVSTPLSSVEGVTHRLEQLAAAAIGVSAPAAAHAPAAAASAVTAAPKVDASKAKAEAEAKAKAEAEAAKKKKDEEEKKAKEEAEKKAKAAAAPAAHAPAHTAQKAAPHPSASAPVSHAKPAAAAAAAPAAAAAKPAAASAASAPGSASASASGPGAGGPFFTLDQLKGPATAVPSGVNYATRELWLSDAEFVKALKVTKAEWAKLPGWKKEQAKKTVGLF